MRLEKKSLMDELRHDVTGSPYLILADYRGMSVAQMEDLRIRLGKSHSRMRVIKNSLFRIMAKEMAYDEKMVSGMEGPCAMVYGQGDPVDAAKVLKEFIKENQLPQVKIGIIEKQVISAQDVTKLSELQPKNVLRGMLVNALASPMSRMAGVCRQRVSSVLYVLKAVQESKEKQQASK